MTDQKRDQSPAEMAAEKIAKSIVGAGHLEPMFLDIINEAYAEERDEHIAIKEERDEAKQTLLEVVRDKATMQARHDRMAAFIKALSLSDEQQNVEAWDKYINKVGFLRIGMYPRWLNEAAKRHEEGKG